METGRKEKSELRKRILKERDSLSPKHRQVWDKQILERLIRYDEENPCEAYLCYVNFRSEVSTREWIHRCLENGKAVFVPKVLKAGEMEFYRIFRLEDLHAGCLGILEPEVLEENSFPFWIAEMQERDTRGQERKPDSPAGGDFLIRMIMPGAVFDKKKNRIGYGGGFYDRWLAKWEEKRETLENGRSGRLEKIGIAYQMQIVEEIAAEPFDQRADLVVTEESDLQGKKIGDILGG